MRHDQNEQNSLTLLRRVVMTVFVFLGAALAVAFAAIWGLGHYFARRIVMPTPARESIRVLDVNRAREPYSVTFSRGEDIALAGDRFSFVFDRGSGHAKIGHILRQDNRVVERELIGVDHGHLTPGVRGRLTGWWFVDPTEIDATSESISITTDIGDLPVWLLRPRQAGEHAEHFVIHVHGRGGVRQETLRGVKVVTGLGMTSLVLAYRNDAEAPAAPDGRYGLGTTEWQDVEAAIHTAVNLGATRITLFGWSMGATAVLLAAQASEYRDRIVSIILESPAVSWPHIIDHHAQLTRLPRGVSSVGARALEGGSPVTGLHQPVRVGELTPDLFAATLGVRTLVIVSDGDTYVPAGPALEFASLRPDLVTLEHYAEGEHVKLWNLDPERWERAITTFLGH